MKQKPNSRRVRNSTKSILRLPDLEHAKDAVLNSLNPADAKPGYRQAFDEFAQLAWLVSHRPVGSVRQNVLGRYVGGIDRTQVRVPFS